MNWSKLVRMLLISCTAFIVVGLAACGDDDDDDDGDGGTTPTEQATEDGGAAAGGEVTVQQTEPESYDPHWSQFAQDISVQRMVWRGLYRLDKDNVPQPEMAADMPEISGDGKVYTVKLRDGLVWSDGDDLLAEDVVAGIIRTCDPDNAGNYSGLIFNIAGCADYYKANADPGADKEALRAAVGVKALDDLTVEFTLINAQPTFTMILSLWLTMPLPSHIVKTPGEAWPDPTKLAFNGPFKITGHTPKDQVVLERNDNYYGTKALLDKITMKFIDQLDVAQNAYEADQLQIVNANLVNLDVIRADPDLGEQYLQGPRAATRNIHTNIKHAPLDNYEVRLALAQATDRATLNEVVFKGAQAPSTTWVAPAVLGGDLAADSFADVTGFDPESAREHLANAGFPDGEGFPVLNLVVTDTPDRRALAEFLKEQWHEHLGIDIEIQAVDGQTRAQRFTSEDYDLFFGGWVQDYPDPENWLQDLWETGGSSNHYGVADPDLDALLQGARFNDNEEERIDQYRQANEMLSLDPMLSGIVLYQESNNFLIKPNIGGARENATIQDATLPGDWNAEAWFIKS
jgi:oligopeptide transport system substrate-binding protein